MKYADIVTFGFSEAFTQLIKHRGDKETRFSEAEQASLRALSKKLKAFHEDFNTRHKELQDEFKDEEFKAKENELVMVDIELDPLLSYEQVKKVPLSMEDLAFLSAHIKDAPKGE